MATAIDTEYDTDSDNVNVNNNHILKNKQTQQDPNPLNVILTKQQTISSAGATSHSTKGKIDI